MKQTGKKLICKKGMKIQNTKKTKQNLECLIIISEPFAKYLRTSLPYQNSPMKFSK